MIGKYILKELETEAKIRVEVSTHCKRMDESFIPDSVKLFINDKEVLCFGLNSWDDDTNQSRGLASELLEALGVSSKEAYRITWNQEPMDLVRTVEY